MKERTKLIVEIAGKLEIAYYGSVPPTSSVAMERHAKHAVSMAERIVKEAEALEPEVQDFRDGSPHLRPYEKKIGERMFEVGKTYHQFNGTKVEIVSYQQPGTAFEHAVDRHGTHYCNRQDYGRRVNGGQNVSLNLRPLW